ncbi:MAG: cyclodeaminase/cyclohydrolase family protein [Candidatus Eremiobacteraeota bacterium]|nr:cyclodeaminase/cyclohydrolase family protein [Candidatus Eremiobacteraeota bacterium]MBC5802269.1 cyclodeaminase/cyclohydrolase family protein [Candidatus Eremiobacteraeota bacterium]MBC5822156.1 cyclodeaminase/cyclohydrolase family protein [Candidatus Eremiobacteraeota bacterium]
MELETYLETLASSAPTPGGGSAATVVVALGAALVAMVARITRDNQKYAAKTSLADDLIAKADAMRVQMLVARSDDEAAFGRVVAASALPRESQPEGDKRAAAVQAALAEAAAAPLRAARLAADVAALAARALELGNPHLASDLGCAADFAAAGLSACAFNVRVNYRYIHDRELIARGERQLQRFESTTAPLIEQVRVATQRALAKP